MEKKLFEGRDLTEG